MIDIYDGTHLDVLEKNISANKLRRLSQVRNFFMELEPEVYFFKFHWLDNEKVTLVASRERLIIITDSKPIRNYAHNIEDNEDGLKLLYDFFLEISSEDIEKLQAFEDEVAELEDTLLTTKNPNQEGISQIIKLRKNLLSIKQYYVQMEFLTDEIAATNSDFNYIDKRFDRLLEFLLHLQEYIEQVREAYQSQIDIVQNELMKVFTVITTIFLPLTLIVGWYGMNLQMPEFRWSFGYPLIIGFSLVVVIALVIVFKKKKWF